MTSYVAIDLGGTRLKAALVTASDGHAAVGPVHVSDPPVVASLPDALADVVRAVAGDATVDGAGLCVPGLVEDGRVASLPGKLAGIVGLDLAGLLRGICGGPAVVLNDAIAFATGEAVSGAGRGARRVVVVTIGTGVGVCVIQDGAPATPGPLGGGLLGGFIPIAGAGSAPPDSTGHTDTIEALCRAARIAGAAGVPTVEDAYAAAARGEARATEGLARYREDLVRALAALAHAHAPDVIVLGGGPMFPGAPVLDGIEAALAPRLYGTYRVRIAPAALGDGAALAGLAHALERTR